MDARSFVSDVLGISDVGKKLAEEKFSLLGEILKALHSIPFQSITLLSSPLQERHKPSIDEVMSEMLSTRGGLCYTVNVFMKLLLESPSYSVYHVVGHVSDGPTEENHIITIVTLNGIKHLVEIGCGYPTFQPISLNFKDESIVYEESFIKYKFKWIDKNKIERYNLFLTPGARWTPFYTFNVTPKELEEFDKPMTVAYTDANALSFHSSFRAIKYDEGKAIIIRDGKLLVEDAAHILQETKLHSDDEVIQAVKDYFPQLEDAAKAALKIYQGTYA